MSLARIRRNDRRRVAVTALAIPLLSVAAARIASAQVPNPTVEGPITANGSPFIASTSFDLSQVGYMQEEYFISGMATAYTSAAALTSDGMWSATSGATAAYKTRILAYRPTNRKKF